MTEIYSYLSEKVESRFFPQNLENVYVNYFSNNFSKRKSIKDRILILDMFTIKYLLHTYYNHNTKILKERREKISNTLRQPLSPFGFFSSQSCNRVTYVICILLMFSV